MPAKRIAIPALLIFLLTSALPARAQQSPSRQDPGWQGARPQQHPAPVPPAQAPHSPAIPQPSPPPAPQGEDEAHPQVQEMPALQAPTPLAPRQPGLSAQPPAVAAPPPGVRPKPAYLGIAGQTVQACRYPAGVRITRVIEGSPAQQAGLKGEGT